MTISCVITYKLIDDIDFPLILKREQEITTKLASDFQLSFLFFRVQRLVDRQFATYDIDYSVCR